MCVFYKVYLFGYIVW